MTHVLIPGYNPQVDDFVNRTLDDMWPNSVERPSFIEVERVSWNFSTGEGPKISVSMPNGARFFVEETDPSGQESALEEFEGTIKWQTYISNREENYAIFDAVKRILELASQS